MDKGAQEDEQFEMEIDGMQSHMWCENDQRIST